MAYDNSINESITSLSKDQMDINVDAHRVSRLPKVYYMIVPPRMVNRSLKVLAESGISTMIQGAKFIFANQTDAYKAAQRVHLYGVHIIESNMDLSEA